MRYGRTGPVVLVALVILAIVSSGGNPACAQTPGMAPDVEVISERMLFTWGSDGPLVLHMVHIVNVGPRLAEIIPLPTPDGAVLLDVPAELVAEAGFVVDFEPLAAGEARQYIFTYELPWQRLPLPIRRPLFYPTALLEVWAEESLVLRGVGLREVGREDLGGRVFTVYASMGLEPHPQWQALLETTAGAAAVSDRERLGQRSDPVEILQANPGRTLLLFAAAALLVVAVAVRRLQARHSAVRRGVDTPTPGTERGNPGEIARLKEQIVQVAVSFQNGDLDEDVYVERRAALRGELLRLLGGDDPTAPGTMGEGAS